MKIGHSCRSPTVLNYLARVSSIPVNLDRPLQEKFKVSVAILPELASSL